MKNKLRNSNLNSLLIIGNGFDLTLGLESRFSDFLSEYKRSIKVFNNILNSTKRKYMTNGLQNGTHSKLEYINKCLLQSLYGHIYVGTDKRKFVYKYKRILKNKNIHLNFWVLYLYLKKKENISDWASVENQIYKCITYKNSDILKIAKCFTKYLKFNTRKASNLPLMKDINLIGSNKNINNIIYILYKDNGSLIQDDVDELIFFMCISVSQCAKYNKSKNEKNYNLLLKSLTFDKYKDTQINPFDIVLDSIFKYLKQQLFEFEKDLNKYLRKCVNNYKTNKANPKKYTYKKISKQLINCLVNNKKFSLINFNYTNPLRKSYRNKRNIHGVLTHPRNKYFSRTSPVIGTSAYGITFNNRAYSFTKDYRIMRLSCNNYNDILYNPINKIVFFGHSLDSADYSYFFNVFDRYNVKDFRIKLVFYYINYSNKTDDQCAITQMNNIDRLFEAYAKHSKESNNIRFNPKDLIHKLSFRGKLVISNIRDEIPKTSDLYQIIN